MAKYADEGVQGIMMKQACCNLQGWWALPALCSACIQWNSCGEDWYLTCPHANQI